MYSVLCVLRWYLTGLDWLNLSQSSRGLRPFAFWNRKLGICQSDKRILPGATHVFLTRTLHNLPNSVKFLHMGDCRLTSDDQWKIPPGVRILCLPAWFNPASTFVLPPKLVRLFMPDNSWWKHSITVFPETLRHLHLGHFFNLSPEGLHIPDTITNLNLGSYNHSTFGLKLPNKLKVLCFVQYFNQEVTWPGGQWNLPDGLKELKLGVHFDQNVIGWKLPKTLRKLHLGTYFNKPLLGWDLPCNLDFLWISEKFNRPLLGWRLPCALTQLYIGECFEQDVIGWVLPDSLQVLKFRGGIKKPVIKNTSAGVKHWVLPTNLRVLAILNPTNSLKISILTPTGEVTFWKLPDGLKELRLGGITGPLRSQKGSGGFSIKGWDLPAGLETLVFQSPFHAPIKSFFNPPVYWTLPNRLSVLDLGVRYDLSIDGWTLPPNLQVLKIGIPKSASSSPWYLPGSLVELHRSCNFPDSKLPHNWKIPTGCNVQCR